MIANNELHGDNNLSGIQLEIGQKILKLLGKECMEHDLQLSEGGAILIEVLKHLKAMDDLFHTLEELVKESESSDGS